MSKTKLIIACVTLAALIVSVLAACAPAAPAKPAATTPPATTTPAKPITPPATTTPPAVTTPSAAATPPKTSYTASTYTNDQYSFLFLYPGSMISSTPKAKYNVFEAADAMGVPSVSAGVLDTANLEAQTEEALKSVGGSDIKTVSTDDAILADGKTKAKLTKLAWKSSGYDITTYSMAVDRPGGKTVSVSCSSLTDMIDAKIAKEVVSTLTFK